jgi:hypothetical protein
VFEETNIKLNEGDLVTDLFIPHPERTILSCSKHKGSFRGATNTSFKWSYGKSYRLVMDKIIEIEKETCSNK